MDIRNSPFFFFFFFFFFVIQKENGNSNMFCKFSIIVCRYCSKWRINVFLKLKRLQQPPSSSDFDGLPYPRVRWYFHFFHENDHKGCKRDYLYALGNFLWRFRATGKNRKGGCNNPPWLDEGYNIASLYVLE